MDNQTKIGIGAAAGIALMALLEPHMYEWSRYVTAGIYILLIGVMLWDFCP